MPSGFFALQSSGDNMDWLRRPSLSIRACHIDSGALHTDCFKKGFPQNLNETKTIPQLYLGDNKITFKLHLS